MNPPRNRVITFGPARRTPEETRASVRFNGEMVGELATWRNLGKPVWFFRSDSALAHFVFDLGFPRPPIRTLSEAKRMLRESAKRHLLGGEGVKEGRG